MNLQRPNSNEATRTANRSEASLPAAVFAPAALTVVPATAKYLKPLSAAANLSIRDHSVKLPPETTKIIPSIILISIFRVMLWAPKVLPKGVKGDSDTAIFPDVNTETEYGWDQKSQNEDPHLHRRSRFY